MSFCTNLLSQVVCLSFCSPTVGKEFLILGVRSYPVASDLVPRRVGCGLGLSCK